MKPMTPRTLDWIDSAPVVATCSRRIAVPVDRVWDEIADHESWPNWFGAITKVERIGSGEGVGSGRRVHLKGGITAEEEFLAWEPGVRFAFTLTASSMPGLRSMVEDIGLMADGAQATTITYTQAAEPGAARVVAPILDFLLPKSLDSGLKGLAKHLGG